MTTESGQISIDAENILPIIKKWLYSEQEIFLRELVANACDALHKLQKVAAMGEETRDLQEPRIVIEIDKQAKTLTISDTGIGMTAEEIKKYINQVAFSGLQDFVQKYQGKDAEHQVIGHFGLGFYSSFMVADRVEIDSLSCRQGTEPAHWSCDGSINFELSPSQRQEVGTTITLHVSESSAEMLEEENLRSIIRKYCAFVKYPVQIAGRTVNDPDPIWNKPAAQLGDKDYLAFFHQTFPACPDPLFWVHMNVDYPFSLRGVLYFPKLRGELESDKGEVKLFCNQVFVANNLERLIPEYLTVLRGVIDCADLPLNVSRSYLQNDQKSRKISQHISKKVGDLLVGVAKKHPADFKNYWGDIHPFVKWGVIVDGDFREKLLPHIIFPTTRHGYLTVAEYLERNGEKTDNKVFYTYDADEQAMYVSMFEEQGIDVLVSDARLIDTHFMTFIEKHQQDEHNAGERKFEFRRIDADLASNLVSGDASKIVDPTDNRDEGEKIGELFRKTLQRPRVKVRVENLKSDKVPAMLIFDENRRRASEIVRHSGAVKEEDLDKAGFSMKDHTLVVNQNHRAMKRLLSLSKGLNGERDVGLMVNQIYDLAYLQHGYFSANMMKDFVERSATILERMGGDSGLIIES